MSQRDVHPEDMFDDDPTLAAFARDLQDAAAATLAPPVGATLAAVLSGDAPAAAYPQVHVPHVRDRYARRLVRVRWAVGSLAFACALSVLGIAGGYPDPVQRQVSRMAEVVGVDLPDGERPTSTTTSSTTSTTIAPTTTTVAPSPSSSVVVDTGQGTPDVLDPTTTTTVEDREDDDDGRGRGRGGNDDDETDDDDNSGGRGRGGNDDDDTDDTDDDDESSGRRGSDAVDEAGEA